MQAEGQNQPMENFQIQQQKAQETKPPSPVYKIDISALQADFLTNFLSSGYSLQIQSKIQKRSSTLGAARGSRGAISKKKSVDTKLLNQVQPQLNRLPSVRSKKSVNIRYNDQISDGVYAKYNTVYPPSDFNRRNTWQGLDESLKPCVKVLNSLKSNKTSWAFREPVDPVALGIPHYTEIIKQPMDLSKIQNNLRTGQYATPTQFHADISKIIRNSYTFNQGNPEYTRVTQQFEEYYFRLIAEPKAEQRLVGTMSDSSKNIRAPVSPPVSRQIKKKKPERPFSSENTISIAEKKQLSINIRRLSREHMKGIVEIVKREGQSKIKDQFDLQDLRPETIRQLQNYVRSKLDLEPVKKIGESDDRQGEESDFEIQSEDQS